MALLAAAIWLLRPTDEKVIKRRLTELAALGSFTPEESALRRAMVPNQLRDYFTPEVSVNIDVPGAPPQSINGRAELIQVAQGFRHAARRAKLQLLDITVKAGTDAGSAVATMTLLVDVNNEKNFVSQELKITFRKLERRWLIERVETIRTLR